jgi:hypothetical protein
MLYLVWLPADPAAAAAFLPSELEAAPGSPVYLNQYVVDDASQTSSADDPEGFGAYSLTYLGVDLAGLDTEAGVPGRFWTHYWNSSPSMIAYALARGLPATGGETVLELDGDTVVGTTQRATGQLRYVTRVGGKLASGRYPFVANLAETFEVRSVEFLDASHDVYALRPAEPLAVTFGFYSPAISFCYPGGEGPLGSEAGS